MRIRLLIRLLRLLAILPLSWLHALGRGVGRLYDLFPNREARAVRINLELCYPRLTPGERRAMRRRVLGEIGCSLMELSYIWFRPLPDVLARVRDVSGAEHLRRPAGQGLILLVPHLGCWEIIGMDLPQRERVTSLYRPPRQPQLESLVKQARERGGSELVPTDSRGVKRIYHCLSEGGVTCILPDQQPASERASVFAPFFGIPALTMLLVQRLARKSGARLAYAYAERLEHGEGYHIHYLPAPEEVGNEDMLVAATALNRGLEEVIRRCPDQYQWSYKRFRAQPDGGRSPYRR